MTKTTSASPSNHPRIFRIVVIEDNDGDVYLLEKALKDRHIDYELTRFEDGEEAIRALGGEGAEGAALPVPDLILIDLNVPRREGFDILRVVRSRPALSTVPVGIFTSSDAQQDRHRVSYLGAERYIHKPPNLEEFIAKVGQAVEEMLVGAGKERQVAPARHAVMVVEKDIHLRTLIGDLLTQARFSATSVEEGYTALDRARKERPALVIADLLLPDIDGLALCRLIKGDKELQETKILVLSVLAAEDRARQAGADAFLKKPIEKAQFVATIHSLLGGGQKEQSA